MTALGIQELGHGRLLADLGFHDTEGLVGAYLIPEKEGQWAMVETGPTTCAKALNAALDRVGIEPGHVRDVFVTHVHLDHAGGAGTVLRHLPRATIHVHNAGAPHLIDPSRLVASARRAWGPASDQLWGPVEPTPAERVHRLEGGERFPVLGGTLEAVSTPGHARHHISLFDTATGALLTGDSAGVRLRGGFRPRPAIPPPDLDLEALFESLERMEALKPTAVWFSHYGPSPDGPRDLRVYRAAVTEWREAGLRAALAGGGPGEVAAALHAAESDAAARAGVALPPADPSRLISGYELAAQGLLRYFRTRGLVPE